MLQLVKNWFAKYFLDPELAILWLFLLLQTSTNGQAAFIDFILFLNYLKEDEL